MVRVTSKKGGDSGLRNAERTIKPVGPGTACTGRKGENMTLKGKSLDISMVTTINLIIINTNLTQIMF